MIKKLLTLYTLLISALCAQAIDFEGLSAKAIEIKPEAYSGLEAIYVLKTAPSGARIVYTTNSGTIAWQRFSTLGGAYAEDLQPTRQGDKWSIAISTDDMGYIIDDGNRRTCFWVTNYDNHRLALNSLSAAPADDCGRTIIAVDGSAAVIPYYSITGRRLELSRELELAFNTLSFDKETFTYNHTGTQTTLPGFSPTATIDAPLCNTTFNLSGDRFLRQWGEEESVESNLYATTAVQAETMATVISTIADNEKKTEGSELGGSAPLDIRFEAAATDAAIFTEWQISKSQDFETIDDRYSELTFDYTFTDGGTTYVRFTANNAEGACEYIGETYSIFIGESKLEIPNAFTPTSSPGVNDEWKVSYRSLISFECHIFNRWGSEIFSTTNPATGWDGKYRGKFVAPGVYYYVIKAVGADGRKYDRAGDINIINFTGSDSSTSGSENTVE